MSHPLVAATALAKRELHLDYLTPELVVFSMFDLKVNIALFLLSNKFAVIFIELATFLLLFPCSRCQ